MTRRISAVTVLLVLLAASAGAAGLKVVRARNGPGTSRAAGQIDTAKILEYLEAWARRDRFERFPESPSFAFYNLYATQAVGGSISPELRRQVVEQLRKSQAPDGGFTMAPGTGDSHVVPTAYALRTLALVDALDSIDRRRAVAFLCSLGQPDGGYRGRTSDTDASLGTTFHAVAALGLLGAIDRVDRGHTVPYVTAHRARDGGFALRPGADSSPGGTFMAVRALKLLGALDDHTSSAVALHLSASRYSGRLREGTFPTLPQVEEEANVLAALGDVGHLDVVDRSEVERFVTSLYVGENGGFGPQPGLGTTPPSTYQAIACLVALGRLKEPARD